jgi:hypothetical protein
MNTELKIQSITYDLQYFFTEKGIVKISLDESENILEYNSENLKIGLNILKENLQVKFDMGLITENDYIYSARKFLYESMNVGNIKNQISVINEWENKYGKNLLFINESSDRTDLRKIFENSWQGLNKLYTERLIESLILEKSLLQWGWDNIKSTISKAFTCAKGSGYIDCFMEGLRTIATSFLGVAVLTGVSFIPAVGQIPNVVIFGALLIYDLYKMMSGKKWSVSDIIVDIVSLLAPSIAKGIGAYTKGLTNFYGLGTLAGKGTFGTIIQTISKGIGNLATIIGKTVGYFSSKLGIKWLGDMAKYAYNGLTKITSDISAGQKAANKETKKSEKAKSATELLKDVPESWKKYPCVALSKNVKQKKTSDGTIVYEGGGFVWFDNGKKIDPKTEEVSSYSCTPEGKIKSGEPEENSMGLFGALLGKSGINKSITYSKCDDFPFEVGCINDKIKRVQSCLRVDTDGKFSPSLKEKMIEKGYGEILTLSVYDKIMKDCGAAPEGSATSSAGFAKDV